MDTYKLTIKNMKKFKEHMEEYPDITLLGLAWSLYWRLSIVMLIIGLVLQLLVASFA